MMVKVVSYKRVKDNIFEELKKYSPYPDNELVPFDNSVYNDGLKEYSNKLLKSIDLYLEGTEIVLSFSNFENFMETNNLTTVISKEESPLLNFGHNNLINTRLIEHSVLDNWDIRTISKALELEFYKKPNEPVHDRVLDNLGIFSRAIVKSCS